MNEQLNWFTILLNNWFGGAANALLKAVHVTPADPSHPIPNFVAATIAVTIIASIFFLWLRPRISAERPGATQQVMELMLTNPLGIGIRDLLEQNIHHNARDFMPLVGSISIFILFSNVISVIPAFISPTGHPSVPLACALLTFVYYNVTGFRTHGTVGYLKHFAGPVPAMSWLIFPVEIISHSARLLSLTVRLWANIFASELIYVIFLGLCMAPVLSVRQAHPALG